MPQAICVNCGKPLEPGAAACAACGRKADGAAAAPASAFGATQGVPAQPAPAAPPVRPAAPAAAPVAVPPAKSASRPLPMSSIVILGLGIAMIVIAVLLLSRKPTPPAGQVLSGVQPPAAASAQSPAPVAAVPAPAQAVAAQPPAVQPVSPSPGPIRQAAVAAPVPPVAAPIPPTPTPPIEKVYVCRKGAEFKIDPDKAIVYVDGERLGKAENWNGRGDDKTYRFERPGVHFAKFVREGYRTGWVKITVRPDADTKIAEVELKLHKHGDKEED